MTSRSERGFVAVEWVAAVALLLLPIVVLVATVPVWAERRHAATVAAREGARVLVRDWPQSDPGRATVIAREVADAHGVESDDVRVHVSSVGAERGSLVRVEVDVRMPAISVMGLSAGAWRFTAVEVRRIDDFRSR